MDISGGDRRMRWFREYNCNPWSYVADDCAVFGTVQSFTQMSIGGITATGFEAYVGGHSIGRHLKEKECKKMVEQKYKEAHK
jgi:hypothetical protein